MSHAVLAYCIIFACRLEIGYSVIHGSDSVGPRLLWSEIHYSDHHAQIEGYVQHYVSGPYPGYVRRGRS